MTISKQVDIDDLPISEGAEEKIETLREIVSGWKIFNWIERKVGDEYVSEEDAGDAVDEFMSKYSIEEMAKRIIGRELTDEERQKLGLEMLDEEGRSFVMVEENP